MKFRYLIPLIATLPFVLNSCKEVKESAPKVPTPKIVQIPTLYTSDEEVLKFLAQHFWDETDLYDTLYLNKQESLDKFFVEYINVLLSCDSTSAVTAIEKWGKEIPKYPGKMRDYLLHSAEDILFNPNSPLREEALYIPFLKGVLSHPSLDSLYAIRYNQQLDLAMQNRPGSIANNFSFLTSKGSREELNRLKGKTTLLLFFEPDCPLCKQSVAHFDQMEEIKSILKSVNFLAIYTGTKIAEWEESLSNFPNYWIVGIDIDREIANNNLYDRRPSPSFYLIDKDGKVLIKDGATEHIVALIEEGKLK